MATYDCSDPCSQNTGLIDGSFQNGTQLGNGVCALFHMRVPYDVYGQQKVEASMNGFEDRLPLLGYLFRRQRLDLVEEFLVRPGVVFQQASKIGTAVHPYFPRQ